MNIHETEGIWSIFSRGSFLSLQGRERGPWNVASLVSM